MNREKDEVIPFQAGVNENLFFPGAQRREILDEVKRGIVNGVAVLSIVGDEGTGKTMLCRMVKKELPDEYTCVYLSENLESFDEVIRIFAAEIGVEHSNPSQSTDETVSAIVDNLQQEGHHLVVIFDQAERMYLAMLERLRKLLDRININENLLQLVFAGRKVLLENLDQLTICDFADAAETHFYLDDLDASETYAYLNHCARQRSRARGKSIFTPEAAKKIYSIAHGNLKNTNILAAKSIESADEEGSFVVAPRNIDLKDTGFEASHESFLAGVRKRSSWIISGALLILLSVLLIILFGGSDEKKPDSLQQSEKELGINAGDDVNIEAQTSSSLSQEQDNGGVKEDAIEESTVNESSIVFKTESAAEAEQNQSQAKQSQAGSDKDDSSKTSPIITDNNKKTDSILQNPQEAGISTEAPEKKPETTSTPVAAGLTEKENDFLQDKNAASNKKNSQVTLSGLTVEKEVDPTLLPQYNQGEKGVSKTPEQILKQEKKRIIGADKQPETEQKETSTVLAESKKSVPHQLQNIDAPKQLFKVAQAKLPQSDKASVKEVRTQPAISGGSLYEQRVAAGKVLFSGKTMNIQTIQIMALSGEQAEKNLRERFSRKQYQEIADNLYILESDNKTTLFVYYGAFPDRESANQAREQLPSFLRSNEPYVISIPEARSKITPQQ